MPGIWEGDPFELIRNQKEGGGPVRQKLNLIPRKALFHPNSFTTVAAPRLRLFPYRRGSLLPSRSRTLSFAPDPALQQGVLKIGRFHCRVATSECRPAFQGRSRQTHPITPSLSDG